MIVSIDRQLASTVPASTVWPRSAPTVSYPASTSIQLFNTYRATYGTIYRTQPSVRKCVDFLARNIAQLGLHVFRRLADNDRARVHDHPLSRVIAYPHPACSRYRLMESTVADLGIYFNAFWLKVDDRQHGLQLQRLPAGEVEVKGAGWPTAYRWQPAGRTGLTFAADDVVHFSGYDPSNQLAGVSAIETLRRVLAEDLAASDAQERFWRRGGRPGSVITRPKDSGQYTRDQAQQFIDDYERITREGRAPILQDGMAIQELGQSARDAQYAQTRQLTDEITAAAYHIPLPMIGRLEHATYSNIKEQHKHLYQDALGPWLAMIVGQIMLQLLSEWEDPRDSDVYVEFNIHEKLRGTFEEQAAALSSAVGRPWMTCNEARARMNLPRTSEPRDDQVAYPLNLLQRPSEEEAAS